jgi:hypothetical protein
MRSSTSNRLFTLTAATALVAALGGTARAGNEVELGATAGIHVFDDDSELGAPGAVQSAPLFGARIGWFYRHKRYDRWYSSLLGAEVELGAGPGEARGAGTSVVNLTYRAHAVAQFRTTDPTVRIVPFVLLGGGAIEIAASDDERMIGKDRDGMLYAGGGAKLRLGSTWEVRVDGRVLFGPRAGGGVAQDLELLFAVGRRLGGLPPGRN